MIDPKNLSVLVADDMKSMRLTIIKMLRHSNVGKSRICKADEYLPRILQRKPENRDATALRKKA